MRSCILLGSFFCLMSTAFGQAHPGQYWSLGGFGNVVYPGTGHAPTATPPGGAFANGFARGGAPAAHPQHRRTNIVPYPVYYGGYGAGYGAGYGYDPSQGYQPGYNDQGPAVNPGSMPSVVINQNFVPPQGNPLVREYGPSDGSGDPSSSLKMYQAPTPGQMTPPQQAVNLDQPTLYLLAFKDRTIVQALGYWMEGATLHYVTVDHDLNQVSLDLIDRDLSQRLNSERNVEFRLPPAR
jgi:hypothetical protein